MEDLPVEVYLPPKQFLGKLKLVETPQPGQTLELAGRPYLILERRHCYHLKRGKYRLWRTVVQVQPASEAKRWGNRWVVGDPECGFNALSPLLRCALHPEGPCEGCPDRQLRPPNG
ncbi:MAG: DUF6464 family protein [Pseudanabaenaceae cyanobacterium]